MPLKEGKRVTWKVVLLSVVTFSLLAHYSLFGFFNGLMVPSSVPVIKMISGDYLISFF